MKYTIAIAALVLAACTDGSPTDSVCPTANAPTYSDFGQHFFTTYCTGCHSASATNRHGAPRSQNYDTEADVRMHDDDIDAVAAVGPAASNTFMPELAGSVSAKPTDAERQQLGQMLACMHAP